MTQSYPDGLLPYTTEQRIERFGKFHYSYDPTPTNPEHIHIDPAWSTQNITMVKVPQLLVNGHPRLVSVNHLAAQPLLDVFAAWEAAGLMHLVLTFDGAWVPRYKRQHGTYDERVARCRTLGIGDLSNHSWGTAMDLNVAWNGLGTPGAPRGAKGSTVELRDIARQHGWFCGADFHSRCDAMHFELGYRPATPPT